MEFIDAIKALLIADTGVTTALSGGVVAATALTRGWTLPAALVHTVTAKPEYTLAGTDGIRETHLQIDVYANTQDDALAGIRAIRSVLKNYRGTLTSGDVVKGTFWESETDMPFSADTNVTGQGYRVMASVCFYYEEA